MSYSFTPKLVYGVIVPEAKHDAASDLVDEERPGDLAHFDNYGSDSGLEYVACVRRLTYDADLHRPRVVDGLPEPTANEIEVLRDLCAAVGIACEPRWLLMGLWL